MLPAGVITQKACEQEDGTSLSMTKPHVQPLALADQLPGVQMHEHQKRIAQAVMELDTWTPEEVKQWEEDPLTHTAHPAAGLLGCCLCWWV